MANVKLLFYGSENSSTKYSTIECFANDQGDIFLEIEDGDRPPQFICLDKSTAIKFSKTLRTEINKI